MSGNPRNAVLEQLAASILEIEISSPLPVAIDGRTASGKTVFADELAVLVGELGRQPIRTSVDGFHRPRAERYARGRYSAEGYYLDARDLSAIRSLLLAPLAPGGDRRFRTASFDLETDRPVEQIPMTASRDSVLIVDGTFLQQPELRGPMPIPTPSTMAARGARSRCLPPETEIPRERERKGEELLHELAGRSSQARGQA